MIYYLVRHKATKEFMPELERGRGYSHWNPAVEPTERRFRPRKLTGCPRLFSSRGKASRCIAAWNAYPNSYMGFRHGDYGNDDPDIQLKDDGRKKEDLEVVEVVILDRLEFTRGFHQMIEDINNEQGQGPHTSAQET
jgi:hypothetical protein